MSRGGLKSRYRRFDRISAHHSNACRVRHRPAQYRGGTGL